MEGINLSGKLKNKIKSFVQGLDNIYGTELVSVVIYGSAASGEFVERHSNLNVLIVLKNTGLEDIKKAFGLMSKYRLIKPLFMTEEYINSSTDVFPIEFLDMQENYSVLYGKDVLKDIKVDTRNLRFQCEGELKAKLLSLKHMYMTVNRNKETLRQLLLKSFTSILHIMRNILRLKGKKPAYKKEELLKEISGEFSVDISIWQKILQAKKREVKLRGQEIETIFSGFVNDLEKVAALLDNL
ncbi:MAG: hypothetical protein ABSB18_08345 [Candidatus Omnitrophota bacterium]